MIHEKVAITVVSRGRTFRKVVTVSSDGSYDQVNSTIKSYVKSAWKGLQVDLFSWSYTE
jgi:hypothetical protein